MCKRIYKDQTRDSGEIPFYKIGTFGSTPDAFISRSLFEEYRTRYPFPEVGSVLISAAGSIGKLVRFNGESAYFQDSNIVWVRHSECIDKEFFAQSLSTVNWKGLEGSTVQRLYNKDLLDLVLVFPTLPEQDKVASLLSTLDRLITLHQRQLELLRQVKKSLLEKMFV